MSNRKGRRQRTLSPSSESSSDDGDLSSASGEGSDPSRSEEENSEMEDEQKESDPLAGFYSKQKRVDNKEPSLTLMPSTLHCCLLCP